MTEHIQKIETLDALHELIATHKDKPIFVDFFAEWCGPCKLTDGDYEHFASTYHEKAIFARVDCDENEDAAQEFSIDSMPTFICFLGGEKIDDVKGAKIEKIKAFFNKHLA